MPQFIMNTEDASTQQQKKYKIKLLNRKMELENKVAENEIKIEIKFKQNIGMSVDIAVVTTAATVDTTQKWNEIKLLNRKIEIRN